MFADRSARHLCTSFGYRGKRRAPSCTTEGVDGSTDSCRHWALISFNVTCEQATRFPSIPLDYREDSKSTLRPRRDLEKMAGLREFLIDEAGRIRLVRGKNPDPPCLLTSKTLSRFYMSSVVLRLE